MRESIQPYPASKPQPYQQFPMIPERVYPTLSCKQAATNGPQLPASAGSLSNPILQASRNHPDVKHFRSSESIQPYPASKPQPLIDRLHGNAGVYPTLSCKQAATKDTSPSNRRSSLSNPILQASRNPKSKVVGRSMESIQPYPASKPQLIRVSQHLSARVYPTLSCKQAATQGRVRACVQSSLSNPILQASRNNTGTGTGTGTESIQPYPASKPQHCHHFIVRVEGVYPTLSCKQAATEGALVNDLLLSLSNPILQASRNRTSPGNSVPLESIQPYPASKPQPSS